MSNQYTINETITFEGNGLHTGERIQVQLRPADENKGLYFVRTDIAENPKIPADADYVADTRRSTTLTFQNNSISMVEHILGLCYGMGIDNLEIAVNGSEIPILDGSVLPLAEKVLKTGLKEQKAPRNYFELSEPLMLEDESRGSRMAAWPSDKPFFEVTLDFNAVSLPTQSAYWSEKTTFTKDIAPARTFVFLHELAALAKSQLVKGGSLENAIVFIENTPQEEEISELSSFFNLNELTFNAPGILGNETLRFPNEPARHKLLDLLGDLALTGAYIRCHISAFRPGHEVNVSLAKKLKQLIKDQRSGKSMPPVDLSNTLFDINRIMELLPHRYPFLLIDKIVEMSETHVVGIKNVTMNEPFFQGHFPGNPVMPGVLQIEAMAQVGGILVMGNIDDPQNYTPYFIKIENVKFKQKVIPGDCLVFWLHLKSPIRRGICHMEGKAYVNGKVVMEGEMMAQIIRNTPSI
jgi:UDP-3-O-[3-hydroxymyristoyl] N-acetylglucosamine deacetylase / 3-hydroxyacyl-[acyl-carrier-protein] dehydratase